MSDATSDTESNLWPSVLLFSAVYLGVSTLLMLFGMFASLVMVIGALIAATAAGARRFVLEHHRALQKHEQLRFALLSSGAFLGKTGLATVYADLQSWNPLTVIIAYGAAAVALVCPAILHLTSGWFSRRFARDLTSTGKI